ACCSGGTVSGSDMAIVDFTDTGSLKGAGWGNGTGATLFNTCNSCCVVGGTYDTNYAMVGLMIGSTGYLTLAGGDSGVLTERFDASTGLRDTTYGPLKSGGGPNEHQSWAAGPSGAAYAAIRDDSSLYSGKVIITGTAGGNDFLAARFNTDGTLDYS